MILSISLMTRWRQRRLARRVLQACGLGLPAWSVCEVSFSAPQAAWLHRSLCLWHGRAGADRQMPAAQPVPLSSLSAGLAERGIALQACRLVDPRGLRRGDVLVLSDAAARRLFGPAALGGGGLALVVQAGTDMLRLSLALSSRPMNCPVDKLQGALAGWVLRTELPAPAPSSRHRVWAAA